MANKEELLEFLKRHEKLQDNEEKQELNLLRCYATFGFLKECPGRKPDMTLLESSVLLPWILNDEKAWNDSALFLHTELKVFLRYFTPSLIEDFDALTDFFSGWEYSSWFAASNIYLAYSVKKAFEKRKYKTQSPYKIFLSGNHAENALQKKSFDLLYAAVSGIELNPTTLAIDEKVNKELHYLQEECGLTDDDIFSVVEQYAFWDTDYSPGRLNELVKKASQKNADNKKFMRAIKLIGNQDNMLSVACKLYLNDKHDILLENSLVYQSLYTGIPENENIIVIDPSPFFIRKWMVDDAALRFNTIFLVDKKYFPAVYSTVKPDHPEAEVVSSTASLLKLCHQIADKRRGSSSVLLFGNHSQIRNACEEILNAISACMDVRTILLNGSGEVENNTSQLSLFLRSSAVAVKKVVLLPRDIIYTTDPKYKAIFEFQIFKREDTHQEEKGLTRFLDYYLEKTGRNQTIQKRDQGFCADFKQLIESNETLRGAYTRARVESQVKNSESKRQKAKEYIFSDELIITCAERYIEGRGIRLDAYVYGPEGYGFVVDKPSGSRNRRKRITESLKTITNIEKSEIENWVLNCYPYENLNFRNHLQGESDDSVKRTVRDVIISAYRNSLGTTVSLKTFAYLHPEIEDKLNEREVETLRFLMRSEIGSFHFPEVDAEKLTSIVNEIYDELTDSKRPGNESIAFRVLQAVFNEAVHLKYCLDNPFAKEKEDYEDLSFTQVRNSSLVPKHFEWNELCRIYQIVDRAINKGKKEYIGIALKLFLGLKSEEICGLIWDDFGEVDIPELSEKVYRLMIRRQVTNDGTKYIPLQKKELYRELVCPPILAEILRTEKEEVKKKCSLEEIGRKPIVNGEPGENRTNKVMSPKQLQKISRNIVKKLGVQDLNVIVPVKGGTEKETNLNLYQGDIFRTNFEHYLRISAKCNLGEIAYILGNKTGITFSNHYCDYGNYQSQLILYLKLKRYNSLFIRNERRQATFLKAKASNQLMEIKGAGYQKHISEISGVFIVNDSHLNMKIESEYGADVFLENLGGDI